VNKPERRLGRAAERRPFCFLLTSSGCVRNNELQNSCGVMAYQTKSQGDMPAQPRPPLWITALGGVLIVAIAYLALSMYRGGAGSASNPAKPPSTSSSVMGLAS
jgi:hypothetical protein